MVTLDDDDEKPDDMKDDSDVLSSESEYEVDVSGVEGGATAKAAFEALVRSAVADLKLEEQVGHVIEEVKERLDAAEPKIKQMDSIFDEIEKDTDALREMLYSNFRPRISQVGTTSFPSS